MTFITDSDKIMFINLKKINNDLSLTFFIRFNYFKNDLRKLELFVLIYFEVEGVKKL